MTVEPLPIRGAFLLRDAPAMDDRGEFRRIADFAALADLGAHPGVAQLSMAHNHLRGTVRGLHWQADPHGEAKTLWCSAGAVFDVLVDIRPDEPTYGIPWYMTLSAAEPVAVHVPQGVAHGYQTLVDGSALTYAISCAFEPSSARSLHWQDPVLAIPWPLPVTRISIRDEEAPPWPPR